MDFAIPPPRMIFATAHHVHEYAIHTHEKTPVLAFATIGCALFFAVSAMADIVLAPLLRDNVMLQRGKPVPRRGRADPSERVTVRFQSQEKHTVANRDGHWSLLLDSMPASAEPADLVASGKNTVTVRNVLVGEVWLCAGQSNMAWTLAGTQGAKKIMAEAEFPHIRHFKVPPVSSALPCDDVGGKWVACTPKTAGAFSALAYYFAHELYQKLNIPIGLINCSWSGTTIEAWISRDTIENDPAWPAISKRWKQRLHEYPRELDGYQKQLTLWQKEYEQAKKENRAYRKTKPLPSEGYGRRKQPSSIYNGLVHRLLPSAIRGVIWYQGESNDIYPAEYRTLFPAMIR